MERQGRVRAVAVVQPLLGSSGTRADPCSPTLPPLVAGGGIRANMHVWMSRDRPGSSCRRRRWRSRWRSTPAGPGARSLPPPPSSTAGLASPSTMAPMPVTNSRPAMDDCPHRSGTIPSPRIGCAGTLAGAGGGGSAAAAPPPPRSGHRGGGFPDNGYGAVMPAVRLPAKILILLDTWASMNEAPDVRAPAAVAAARSGAGDAWYRCRGRGGRSRRQWGLDSSGVRHL